MGNTFQFLLDVFSFLVVNYIYVVFTPIFNPRSGGPFQHCDVNYRVFNLILTLT